MRALLLAFSNRRILITLILAFSSSLPLPLTTGTLDAWMVKEGVNLKTVGIFSLVGIPYTVKYLWAPLLDRYAPPFLNRRTGWMVVAQLGLMASIFVLGTIDPRTAPGQLALVAVVVAFLSASQDIVIDAYRAELLHADERGPGAGVTVMGGRIGLLTAGAIAFVLADHFTWREVYWLMAGLMSIGLVTAFLAPAPTVASPPPRSLQQAVALPLASLWKRKNIVLVLVFIVLYKLGDAMTGKMTTPFLLKLDFTTSQIGQVNKGFGMIMTIVGGVIGGGIVTKIGLWPSLWWFGILQAVSNLTFSGLALLGKNYMGMVAAIGIENICGGMGTAAFVAFLISLCDENLSATQYAILSSVMALTRTFSGVATGYLALALGWPLYFVVCTILALPGLALCLWLWRQGAGERTVAPPS